MNKSSDAVCPVCKTQDDGEIVLVSIAGTREGNMMEAEQFHLMCLDLVFDKKHGVIYQTLK